MACDIEKIEDNEKENPNIVIQLNTLGLDELVSLTLKLEEEWKLIKKNYTILEGAVVTYDKCKNSVKQLNPSKYKSKNYNAFINELEKSDLIKLPNENTITDNKSEQVGTEKKNEPIDIHIPLTSLVYIPGKIVDTENFLVHMGTNYYVQRNSDQTIEYFDNKIKKLNEKIKKIKVTLIEKRNEIELCKHYIQIKRGQQINETNQNHQTTSVRTIA
ncbi:prefoldin subunit 5, putative [Plasmodium yoelii]|uniref:Prefoldin subunit 5 n=2 Tax=Plasmodium yoelii TaxID=5861 RepID=A0AAE9WP39_PLAYO|nr:prefoldin subunit 5, putative [Plasmodium yoelii]WBY57325.1 prefoldin subunit 5 [Plasmodium yoelii yoelii]CDU17994.1 cochaperone prefoldin complex subunit, putative [Plasmodium yoelii]VTZ78411.1 prefoldin subunit 5, putative [Plasmodium yoelii]|eukprot:XP_022812189.1 prefoldin subunit 5, putative [Plasmodium yoelii]